MIENNHTSITYITKLQELKTHVSICHLNAQSMVSTFNEFQFMIYITKFDIITLSKTWLKNGKHLIEYVSLPGYKLSYRNRDEKEVVVLEYTWMTALTTKLEMALLVLMKHTDRSTRQSKNNLPTQLWKR